MKRKRFSVEQITAILKRAETGTPVGDVCRQAGVSEQPFYRGKKVYGTMLPGEARELKQLREENSRLKRLVATSRGHLPRPQVKRIRVEAVFWSAAAPWPSCQHAG